jgi:G3E family GTPase
MMMMITYQCCGSMLNEFFITCQPITMTYIILFTNLFTDLLQYLSIFFIYLHYLFHHHSIGKTTLLNHILSSEHKGRKYAVIVNDMNELNIDSMLVKPFIQRSEEKLIELSNGCICCTLREDLLKEVTLLANQGRFDHLIIESTGISEPLPVAETFTFRIDDSLSIGGSSSSPSISSSPSSTSTPFLLQASSSSSSLSDIAEIDSMVTLIDGVNFLRDIDKAEELLERGLQADENDHRSINDLLVSQVEFASIIIINKCDLISTSKLLKIKQTIRALNSNAKILESTYSKINIDEIIGSNTYDFDKVSQSATWLQAINNHHNHHRGDEDDSSSNNVDGSSSSRVERISETEEYGISSFVYRARKPFHPMRLMNFIENELVGDDGEDDDSNVDDEDKDKDDDDIINPGPSSSTTTTTTTTSTTTTTTTTSSSTRVLRSKGFFWLASRPRDTMIWSQAGGLFHLTNGGAWWADTPKSEWPNVDGSAIDDSSSGGSIDDSSNEMILLDTTSKIISYHDSDDNDNGGDVTDDNDVEEVQAMLDQINSDWQEPYGDRRYQ